jgi:long-subunit fatty acid transport protein
MVAASGRLATVDVNRTPGGSAQARDLTWPSALGPQSYFALSTDFGGDRFTIGFATYMPYLQRVTFPLSPNYDEPTRYQALALDLRNLVLVPALSIRFAGDLRIGFAPGFLFSTGRVMFAEDLALADASAAVEDPQAAARYDVSSGHGFGASKFSVTLGAGIYYRRRSVEIGVAYQSRPLGGDVDGVEVAGQQTTVRLPPRDPVGGGMLLTCPAGQTSTGHADRCVFGDVAYKLPDVWIGGATWRLGPGLELSAMLRWLRLSVHDRMDIRLSGPTLDADGHNLPQHVVLHRGFKDVWDTRVRVSYWWRERIRIGAMMRFETSAVDAGAVNAAAVDGFKIQPVGLLEVRILRQLWLGAGYGVTFMRTVDVNSSAFNPEYARGCAVAGNDITNDDCRAQQRGLARPTATGQYSARTHDFGLTMTLKF